jgi:hypothetical protein
MYRPAQFSYGIKWQPNQTPKRTEMNESKVLRMMVKDSKENHSTAHQINRAAVTQIAKLSKRTMQVISYLSSVLDRKELMQPSAHRSTNRLYML